MQLFIMISLILLKNILMAPSQDKDLKSNRIQGIDELRIENE